MTIWLFNAQWGWCAIEPCVQSRKEGAAFGFRLVVCRLQLLYEYVERLHHDGLVVKAKARPTLFLGENECP